MIAQELEVSLHMAFVEARQQRHEFITVEHLLLALLDNPRDWTQRLKRLAEENEQLAKRGGYAAAGSEPSSAPALDAFIPAGEKHKGRPVTSSVLLFLVEDI